jgi:hypothetical protein
MFFASLPFAENAEIAHNDDDNDDDDDNNNNITAFS